MGTSGSEGGPGKQAGSNPGTALRPDPTPRPRPISPSISLYGAYPDPDGQYPAPRWGHPKDRRPDLKQIQTGLAVSGDGGSRCSTAPTTAAPGGGPGRRGDDRAEADRRAAPVLAGGRFEADLLYQRGGDECPGRRVRRAAGRLTGAGGAVRRAAARGGHRGGLCRQAGRGQARRRPGTYRVSGGRRDGPARAPQERPGGAPAPDPGVLLGKRRRRGQGQDAEAGQGRRRTGQAGAHRRDPVPPHRRCRGRPRPGDRRQTPRREVPAHGHHRLPGRQTRPGRAFDQDAIDAEAAADGWYALLANLAPGQACPAEVFRRYKGQHVVERRYGEFKGPSRSPPCS